MPDETSRLSRGEYEKFIEKINRIESDGFHYTGISREKFMTDYRNPAGKANGFSRGMKGGFFFFLSAAAKTESGILYGILHIGNNKAQDMQKTQYYTCTHWHSG